MAVLATTATWALKLLGLAWAIGGVYVIITVRNTYGLEVALDTIESALPDDEDEAVADPGRHRWMAVGGVLTTITGVGLVLSNPWVMAPLTLLLIHQLLYARRQDKRVDAANTDEGRQVAAMSASAARAARFSVIVWGVAALLFGNPLGQPFW